MQVFDNVEKAYEAFRAAGIKDPLLEVLYLFDTLSGGELRQLDRKYANSIKAALPDIAQQRAKGVPLAYVLGKAVFMERSFHCTPDTLIPRKETELLVRVTLDLILGLQHVDSRLTVVDVGTGCGNVAVSLALLTDDVDIFASDISAAAVAVARQNVATYGLEDRITLLCGDLLAPLCEGGYAGKIDLVVCNPPYIPTTSLPKLASEIIDHEPKVALDAGAYGMDIFRRLVAQAGDVLRPGGILVFEIGAGQERLVTRLLERTRLYENIEYYQDHDEIRVVSARRVTIA
jgi:release factor glutamine methyltransferase